MTKKNYSAQRKGERGKNIIPFLEYLTDLISELLQLSLSFNFQKVLKKTIFIPPSFIQRTMLCCFSKIYDPQNIFKFNVKIHIFNLGVHNSNICFGAEGVVPSSHFNYHWISNLTSISSLYYFRRRKGRARTTSQSTRRRLNSADSDLATSGDEAPPAALPRLAPPPAHLEPDTTADTVNEVNFIASVHNGS